jgi:hypothetical protein
MQMKESRSTLFPNYFSFSVMRRHRLAALFTPPVTSLPSCSISEIQTGAQSSDPGSWSHGPRPPPHHP